MEKDWVEDEQLSRDETLARFRALKPEKTVGPALPGGARVVESVRSYNATVSVTIDESTPWPGGVVSGRSLTLSA